MLSLAFPLRVSALRDRYVRGGGGGREYLPDDGVIHFGCNAVFFLGAVG
jgi:hypothetical protein